MYQAKTFHASFGGTKSPTADEQFNKWIKDHPGIVIKNFSYQQARYGDHSICILYDDPKLDSR